MTHATTSETTATDPWIPNDGTFGTRLAMIRQRMAWNVTEAARETGVQAESWRLWEQGREPRRLVTIAMAIASRTNVDIDWLVYGRLKPGREDNARYPRTLADLMDDRPSPALAPRVIARVNHGDGRRRTAPARGRTQQTSRQRKGPVSLSARA